MNWQYHKQLVLLLTENKYYLMKKHQQRQHLLIEVLQYTTDDIKMVYQDTFGTTGVSTFAADTKLYNRILTGFSGSDQLNVINIVLS